MMTRESHDSIADHYQQASLHLEAAAEHLNELWLGGYLDHDTKLDLFVIRTAALRAEQRAQAALKETNGHP